MIKVEGVFPLRELRRAVVQSRRKCHCRRRRNQVSALPRIQFTTACEPFQRDRQMSGRREQTLWTYLPNTHPKITTSAVSRSALDMAASTSACTSPNPPTELWLSSSGRVMRRPLSWRGWRTRPWLRHLSGTICDPSTADRGAVAFISSLPVIPASPSAAPESAAAKPIRDTSGPKSRASSPRPSRNGFGAKMSKGICRWDTPASPTIYAKWVTRQRRGCSAREKLAQATGVAASSSWPTPTASDAGYVPDLQIVDGAIRLTSPHDISEGSGGQFALNESARMWTALWLTMKALGWSATTAVCRSSHPVLVSFKHGKSSFLATLMPNPQFYEMSMGWPVGWTEPEVPVTGFAVWLQRSRGQFSRLLTNFPSDDGEPV